MGVYKTEFIIVKNVGNSSWAYCTHKQAYTRLFFLFVCVCVRMCVQQWIELKKFRIQLLNKFRLLQHNIICMDVPILFEHVHYLSYQRTVRRVAFEICKINSPLSIRQMFPWQGLNLPILQNYRYILDLAYQNK